MSEARIGRVLVASLHQAIADLLPTRLEFYENWLNVAGLREGTIGLAPLTAVLSFLRTEGDAYSLITSRAGEYAAAWTFENVPALKRAGDSRAARRAARPRRAAAPPARWSGRPIRARAPSPGSRRASSPSTSADRSSARSARPRSSRCARFYASAIARVLQLFDVSAEARVNECRAVGRRGAAAWCRSRWRGARATARSRHDPPRSCCGDPGRRGPAVAAAAGAADPRRALRNAPAATAAPTGSAKRSRS